MSSIPAYQASGLASNMDTQGIIDKLVSIEGMPLTTLSKKQAGITVQVSTLGALMASLDSLNASVKNVATVGLNTVTQQGSTNDFTVSGAPTTGSSYAVRVQDMAKVAKARSTTFYANGDAVVSAGAQTLSLSVDGQQFDIAVVAGTKLKDLVTQINTNAGATSGGTAATLPFTASLVSDGTQSYLSLTNKKTGFVVGQPATSALSVVSDIGLGLGSPPELQAHNAVAFVDGLRVESRNNTISDVVPGASLTLKAAHNTEETLLFAPDNGSAAGKLQAVLNAFNKVSALIGTQTDSDPASQNTGDKLGSGVVLGIQRRLQQLVSTEVSTTGPVRTLRDLGVSLQKDGTLKLDASVLNSALAKDPDACNAVFAKPTSGLSSLVDAFVKGQTNAGTGTQMGALVSRKNGLDANNKLLTRQADALQTHLDAYRRQLNIQFTALEQVMSGINSTARFLDAQSAQLNKK